MNDILTHDVKMSKTHRVNLILKGSLAEKFGEVLKIRRLEDIRDSRKITSDVEMVRILLQRGLKGEGLTFENKTISIEKSRGRFLIRFNPKDLERLKEIGFDPLIDKKVNVTLTR